MSDDLSIFIVEGAELTKRFEEQLLVAEEKNENALQAIIQAFGALHTIKGNAMYMNFKPPVLVECCQKVESLLSNEDRSPKLPEQADLDFIFSFVDALNGFFNALSKKMAVDEANKSCLVWALKWREAHKRV